VNVDYQDTRCTRSESLTHSHALYVAKNVELVCGSSITASAWRYLLNVPSNRVTLTTNDQLVKIKSDLLGQLRGREKLEGDLNERMESSHCRIANSKA
jgi:hypothetical protein